MKTHARILLSEHEIGVSSLEILEFQLPVIAASKIFYEWNQIKDLMFRN